VHFTKGSVKNTGIEEEESRLLIELLKTTEVPRVKAMD